MPFVYAKVSCTLYSTFYLADPDDILVHIVVPRQMNLFISKDWALVLYKVEGCMLKKLNTVITSKGASPGVLRSMLRRAQNPCRVRSVAVNERPLFGTRAIPDHL